jgi:hypothetical protein
MIPSDLASRLRTLNEASFFSGEPNVAPLARVKAISANLPEFTPGQRITASLQATSQDNTYQARIDGRDVILSLPQGVKAGDSLELIVSHVTPQAVFATLAQPAADTTSGAALSQTGKLISFLLTGQPAAGTASLNGGQALLAAAPQTAAATAQLASNLGAAVAESGLFYESHQARWLSGQVDTASLLKEPQGRESTALLKALTTAPAESAESAAPATTAAASAGTKADLAPVAERLQPLVHQQLDAIATHQLVWQGQVWPGQNMEWEIEDPARDSDGSGDEPESTWNTTLRLTLPSLGGVEARLHLTPAGIAVRLIADDSATRNTLEAAESRLAEALAAANVPLTGMVAELRQVS